MIRERTQPLWMYLTEKASELAGLQSELAEIKNQIKKAEEEERRKKEA